MPTARTTALKLMAALALAPACTAVAAAAPAQAESLRAVPASQRIAILERRHAVFSRPSGNSHRLRSASRRRPITGARTVLPILAEVTGSDGRHWLHVRLPGRPNGHSGWISARFTTLALTPWRLRVDTSRRQVKVFRSGRVVRTFRGVVGAPSTPTPVGRFFVEETVRLGSSAVGAPYALALSARSRVLDQFAGGPGQIALHGMGNVGGTLGTAASHGCVRLDRRAISWLAARIGPGVPVVITR